MVTQRILLISLSNIGDAVMTTPVLQALHDLYPDAVIDLVADRRSSAVFLHCPCRGNIFHKDKQGFLRGMPALVSELRRTRYSLVVDLRTEILAWFLRAEKRLCRWHAQPYGAHAVERHMGIIHSLHGDRPIPSCTIWLGREEMRYAREVLQGQYGDRILAIGPGANWPGKIWPQRNYLELIECLRQDFTGVVLLGDDRDRQLSGAIAEKSVVPSLDLCGRTTVLQAAAVLREAGLFVGNDSGLGHMASGVQTPTVTIFGPGEPERYRPWGERVRCATGSPADISTVTVANVLAQCQSLEVAHIPGRHN